MGRYVEVYILCTANVFDVSMFTQVDGVSE
jgi:hypothetical protein